MKPLITAASLLAMSLTAMAEGKLKIGDTAPLIKAAEWIQGEPVTELSKDNVYVVEFWATWCGPCVATIPHLDALHEELKDSGVVFIGQNVWERDLEKVKPFVEKMGEKMSYRVATDDTSSEEKGYMAVNWMKAADQNGIPAAFVVGKDGKIAWIGHPARLDADLLKQVAAGTFDSAKAAKEAEEQKAAQAASRETAQKYSKAFREKDWETASAILDEMEKKNPERAGQLTGSRFGIAMGKGDSAEVTKLGETMLAGPIGNSAGTLNRMAWDIATKLKDPSPAALELAAKAAAKAVEKDDGKAAIYDTLARVQFLQGKKEEAIKSLETALGKAEEGEQKEAIKKNLESYQKGELPVVAE